MAAVVAAVAEGFHSRSHEVRGLLPGSIGKVGALELLREAPEGVAALWPSMALLAGAMRKPDGHPMHNSGFVGPGGGPCHGNMS